MQGVNGSKLAFSTRSVTKPASLFLQHRCFARPSCCSEIRVLGPVGFLTVASGSHVANTVRLKVIMKSIIMRYLFLTEVSPFSAAVYHHCKTSWRQILYFQLMYDVFDNFTDEFTANCIFWIHLLGLQSDK